MYCFKYHELFTFSINFVDKCVCLKLSQSWYSHGSKGGYPVFGYIQYKCLELYIDHVHEAVCAADSADNVQFARYFRKSTRCTLKS